MQRGCIAADAELAGNRPGLARDPETLRVAWPPRAASRSFQIRDFSPCLPAPSRRGPSVARRAYRWVRNCPRKGPHSPRKWTKNEHRNKSDYDSEVRASLKLRFGSLFARTSSLTYDHAKCWHNSRPHHFQEGHVFLASTRCTTLVPTPSSRPIFKMPKSDFKLRILASTAVATGRRPSFVPFARALCKSRIDALADHAALELGEHTKHLEHRPPGRRAGIEGLLMQVQVACRSREDRRGKRRDPEDYGLSGRSTRRPQYRTYLAWHPSTGDRTPVACPDPWRR